MPNVYCPTLQATQTEHPAIEVKVPNKHGVHTVEEFKAAIVPAAQETQAEYPEEGADLPTAQALQEDDPVFELNLPAAQGMH